MTENAVRHSAEMIEEFNLDVRSGAQQIDPRQDSGHPLHDIVCGWCGEIHIEGEGND